MRFYLLACFLWCSISASAQNNPYFPAQTAAWDTLAPSALNWCPDKIDSLYQYLEDEQTKAFLVLKGGRIVLEKYFDTFTVDSLWQWNSAGKGLTASLVGQAQAEGHLSIQDPTSNYLGQGWTSLPAAKENLIEIQHQLQMTTGLDPSNDLFCTLDTCLTYAADAGTQWYYHNAPYSLLRDVLEQATGTNLNIYTQQRIKNPIGMGTGIWVSAGFNNIFFSTARDMARFGWLMANEGKWAGQSVLQDSSYVQDMLQPSQSLNPSYGYLWWLNGQSSFMAPGSSLVFPGAISSPAPADVWLAAGKDAQLISYSPSEDLLVVRMGNANNNALVSFDVHDGIWERLMNLSCLTAVKQPAAVGIRLFPNPARDLLHIELPTDALRLELYNALGILQQQYPAQNQIELSDLPKGMYYLRVYTASGAYPAQPFVKAE